MTTLRIKKVVNNMVEKKYYNTQLYSATASTTSYQLKSCFIGLTQGNTASTRLGQKIRLHAIHFTIFVSGVAGASAAAGSICRMILYHNKDTNGVQVTGAELFNTDDVLSSRAVPYMPKVSLLKDVVFSMYSPTGVAGAGSTAPTLFKWSIYPKKTICYSKDTAVIADILKDDYGFGFASDDAGCCTLTCNAQVIFSDA